MDSVHTRLVCNVVQERCMSYQAPSLHNMGASAVNSAGAGRLGFGFPWFGFPGGFPLTCQFLPLRRQAHIPCREGPRPPPISSCSPLGTFDCGALARAEKPRCPGSFPKSRWYLGAQKEGTPISGRRDACPFCLFCASKHDAIPSWLMNPCWSWAA